MDNRLRRVHGQRFISMREPDLPEVARSITAVVRGQAKASVHFFKSIRYVHVQGGQVDAHVLASDWVKIMPSIQSGFFSPQAYPVEGGQTKEQDTLNKYHTTSLATKDPLYDRVLANLRVLFPETYPT